MSFRPSSLRLRTCLANHSPSFRPHWSRANAFSPANSIASAFASEVVRRALHPQDLELAGFAPAREAGPELEVWIHECARGDDVPGVVWIPVGDLLGRIGNPGLRDPVLVAATTISIARDGAQDLRHRGGVLDAVGQPALAVEATVAGLRGEGLERPLILIVRRDQQGRPFQIQLLIWLAQQVCEEHEIFGPGHEPV